MFRGYDTSALFREDTILRIRELEAEFHVAQVDGNLDHITHGCPCLQYRSDIVHGLLLGLYIFPHCLVSLGIEGAGSRYVDMPTHTTLF